MQTVYRVYGKKIKQIAEETGHSKNTIRKILRNEYKGYKARKKQLYPVLGHYLKIINKWNIGLGDIKKVSSRLNKSKIGFN